LGSIIIKKYYYYYYYYYYYFFTLTVFYKGKKVQTYESLRDSTEIRFSKQPMAEKKQRLVLDSTTVEIHINLKQHKLSNTRIVVHYNNLEEESFQQKQEFP